MVADDIRMKRKIQQLGSSTLAVTLPAEWARAHGAKKGDEVIVQSDESGGSLLIIPDATETTAGTAVVDADALDAAALKRTILAQYVLGRSLIRIEGTAPLDTSVLDAIADVERQLMGLGIVEQTADRVEIRCSIAPGDFELPTLLERLWRTEATMREYAVTALLEGDADIAHRTIHHESQLETLYYLFLRLIFTTYRNPRLNESVGLDTGFPLIGYRSVAQDVVLMAGCARETATMIVDSDSLSAPDGETADRFVTVSTALEAAVDATRSAVFDPSHATVGHARGTMDELATAVDDAQAHLETERPEPLLELQRSLTALRSCGNHAADSLDVAGHLAARSNRNVTCD
jgi:phosphate uptake regulator